jgi:hypothetical protein
MKISVVMDFLVGGAFVGLTRIANALSEYTWVFTTEVQPSDVVLYLNNHRHYERAKQLGIKHIIQRKTGERSLKVPTPADLDAVICASLKSFNYTQHKRKILIYNGLDLQHLSTIIPQPNIDLLVGESRIGKGQCVDLACEYALKHNRHLTILGDKANLAEDTYYTLKAAYPQFSWIGQVSPDVALSYIKGCSAIIVGNKAHGVSNTSIEATLMGRQIIDLTGCLEIPPIDQLDLNITAKKYRELLESLR